MAKQEKCPCCTENDSFYQSEYHCSGWTDSVEIWVNSNKMRVDAIAVNNYYSATFDINFCPMCGAEL